MLRFLTVLASVAFFCAPASSGLYGKDVRVMPGAQFRKEVLGGTGLYIVKFFSSGCGHCVNFAPEYEKAAVALRGVVPVIAVDDQAVMGEFEIRGFPTVKAVIGNSGGKAKTFDFAGNRDAKSVVDFALAQVGKHVRSKLGGKTSGSQNKPPSSIIILSDENFEEKVIKDEKSVWFVQFHAPWCGMCKQMASDIEAAAHQLKGKVKVGKVDCDKNKMICTRYGIEGYPTMKLFPKGDKQDSLVQAYEGARNSSSIAEYALSYASGSGSVEQIIDQRSFDELCKNEDSAASVCLIAFLPHILDVNADTRKNQLQTLTKVAQAKTTVPVAFGWAQGGDFFFEFEEPLNLAFGYPAVIAYSHAKEMYSTHRGNFSIEHVSSFISNLMIGKAPLSPMPKNLKTLPTVSPWDGKDAPHEEL